MFLYNLLPLSSVDPEGIGMACLGRERPRDHLHPGGVKPLTFLECWKELGDVGFFSATSISTSSSPPLVYSPHISMLPESLFLGSLADIQLYLIVFPYPSRVDLRTALVLFTEGRAVYECIALQTCII